MESLFQEHRGSWVSMSIATGRASLVAQKVRNPPAMQETWSSLGREDPLEQEIATYSIILAWKISCETM